MYPHYNSNAVFTQLTKQGLEAKAFDTVRHKILESYTILWHSAIKPST